MTETRNNMEPQASRKVQQVRSARSIICRILKLDGSYFETSVDKRSVGDVLFDLACNHLDLLERDYFGLSYRNPALPVKQWLNHDKKISKQMKGLPWDFAFEVKFYPSDPQMLHEDLTRYQLCLQLRNDIVSGKLPCSVVTYSLLGSYTVQSELGDFDMEEHGPGIEYLRDMQFAPNQDRELLRKIADLHKTHRGQTPEESELHFLENAKKLAMYGVQLQDAKDVFGVDIQIGVCASGIIIFQDKLQINKFVWPKVIKMSYRRSKFYIKLRAGEFEDFQSQIGFRLANGKLSKILWKLCVEHHSFFRFKEADAPKKRGLFPRFGSQFRYSGRTMFQTRSAMQLSQRQSPHFDRVHSKRATFGGRSPSRDDEFYKPRPKREREARPVAPPHRPEKDRHDDTDRYDDREMHDDRDRHEDRHSSDEREYSDHDRGEDSEEDSPMDRKSRMEKIHAVPTPLAAVMHPKDKSLIENNVEGPPRYNHHDDHHEDDDEDSLPEKPPRDEIMERSIDVPPSHREPPPCHEPEPETPPRAPLSKKEIKRLEKEEKAKLKKEKDEAKKRKKAEEQELKKLEKLRKKSGGKNKQDITKDWHEAVAVANSPIPHDSDEDEKPRQLNRLGSFEKQKDSSQNEKHEGDEERRDDEHSEPHSDEEDHGSESEDEHKPPSEHEEKPVEQEAEKSRVGEEFDL